MPRAVARGRSAASTRGLREQVADVTSAQDDAGCEDERAADGLLDLDPEWELARRDDQQHDSRGGMRNESSRSRRYAPIEPRAANTASV